MQARSPLRIDLAGGTLDCWPLFILLDKAITLNFPIDLYTKAELEKNNTNIFEIECSDLQYKKNFSSLDEILNSKDQEVLLIQKVLAYFRPNFSFSLKTSSESPLVGGGLGASSSLCISLLKLFYKALNKEVPSLYDMASLASRIELQVLHFPTGTQDYFPAIEPRFHALHYDLNGVSSERLEFDYEKFKNSFFIVNTAISHHSGLNNWDVLKKSIEKDKHTLESLKKLNQISFECYEALKKNDLSILSELLTKEYRYRTELSSSFSSPRIEELRGLVKKFKSCEVKICGAGGGGCVMVWCSPDEQEGVKSICQKNQFHIISAKPLL